MNNKKVILVIILFIGISFIVYSFANPLTEEENWNGNGANPGISEGNNTGNDIIDDDNNQDDDSDKEDEENKNSDEDDTSNEEENDDSSNQIAQDKPSNGNQNQTKPTPPKYYCQVVRENYYGSSGNIVSYANFVSQCDPWAPSLKLTVNLDGPYTVKIGTSKNLSDFYNSSFGMLGGSVTCKNGNSVITNLNQIKNSGTYTIVCTATGGNGKNTSVSIPVRIKPLSNITSTLGTFTRTNFIYDATVVPDDAKITIGSLGTKVGNGKVVVTNNLKVNQTGNEIYVTGSMLVQTKDPVLNSNKYITLNYIGERQYTKEEIDKAKFYINGQEYHPNVGIASNGNSYVSFKRNFRKGDSFTVGIDWGDGNGRYDYEVHYDADVFAIDEVIESIKEQLGIIGSN